MLLDANYFKNNSAKIKGGAIHLDQCLPNETFRKKNVFELNKAIYGNDYSTYPIRIRRGGKEKNYPIIPGIYFPDTLQFYLIDHYDQIVTLNYTS